MRIARFALTSALLLAAAGAARAESTRGNYQFVLGDKVVKYVEFDATKLADGSTSGRMFFSDEAVITPQDVDGTGEKSETMNGFNITAELDGLVVDKNRAVMSGTIRQASHTSLLGRRVLLTVEDNGDNTRIPDRLTWGVYNPIKRGWTPSDGELKEDPGVGLTWWATDAEVKGDRGYAMPRPEETYDTQTYLLAAYAYADITDSAGDIVVSP